MPELTTFSIVAHCPRTGRLGMTVSTAVPAVGALCPFAQAGVGVVSTQSWVNPYLAIEALERMAAGAGASEALDVALAGDEASHLRQIGGVDALGRSAAWTGEGCTPWAGHVLGPGFAIQGNMLVGEATLTEMRDAFLASEDEDLDERLMRALEAGQAAGGDKRGKQSAALLIHDREAYPWLDLRVDEHAEPVKELRRVLAIARLQLRPFVDGMPRRGLPAAGLPPEVTDMLLAPPPDRPGGGGSQREEAAGISADVLFPPGFLTVPLSREREAAAWAAFEPILAEIARLRNLDLTEVHPAVVFLPGVPAPDGED